jgi:hypothetical protein
MLQKKSYERMCEGEKESGAIMYSLLHFKFRKNLFATCTFTYVSRCG